MVKSDHKGVWQFKPHREEPPKEGGAEAFQKWRDKLLADKEREGYDFAGITDLKKWIAWNFRRVEQAHASRAYEGNVATTIKPTRRRQLLFDTGNMVHACRKEFARHGTNHRFSLTNLWGVGSKRPVRNYGRCEIPYRLHNSNIVIPNQTWECVDTSKEILSAARMLKKNNLKAILEFDDRGNNISRIVDKATGEEAELVCSDETFWLEADIPELNSQFLAPLGEGGSSASSSSGSHAAGDPAQRDQQEEEFPFDPDARPADLGPESSQQQPASLESERQDVEMIPVPAIDSQPILGPAGTLPTGLAAASSQAEMKARLEELYAPVWGDKQTLWKRLS